MNEFTARKMGEVLAFARIGVETFERGKEGLLPIFAENVGRAVDEFKTHASRLTEIATKHNVLEVMLKKAEATGGKLRSMRDLYLKEDDWKDPAELLEWSGFYEGAAVVHWGLLRGAAQKVGDPELSKLADEAKGLHERALQASTESIEKLAAKKASE